MGVLSSERCAPKSVSAELRKAQWNSTSPSKKKHKNRLKALLKCKRTSRNHSEEERRAAADMFCVALKALRFKGVFTVLHESNAIVDGLQLKIEG